MRNLPTGIRPDSSCERRAGRNAAAGGGGGGIRTHGGVAPTPVFKTGTFDRSATPPQDRLRVAGFCPAVKRVSRRNSLGCIRTTPKRSVGQPQPRMDCDWRNGLLRGSGSARCVRPPSGTALAFSISRNGGICSRRTCSRRHQRRVPFRACRDLPASAEPADPAPMARPTRA